MYVSLLLCRLQIQSSACEKKKQSLLKSERPKNVKKRNENATKEKKNSVAEVPKEERAPTPSTTTAALVPRAITDPVRAKKFHATVCGVVAVTDAAAVVLIIVV